MARPRKYTLNQSYFDSLTDNSAYLIGLIMADGTIGPDRFSLTAKLSDYEFLSTLAIEMGSNRPVQHVTHPHGKVVRLAVNSTRMASRLQHFGIHSPRSWTATTHPDLFFNKHYWRGVIDGDGSLCVSNTGRKIIRLVGSEPICNEFRIFARMHNIGHRISVCHHKTIYTVSLNGVEAIVMAGILYDNAELFLPRKMNKVIEWRTINGCSTKHACA